MALLAENPFETKFSSILTQPVYTSPSVPATTLPVYEVPIGNVTPIPIEVPQTTNGNGIMKNMNGLLLVGLLLYFLWGG